jgi:hypothetical protein
VPPILEGFFPENRLSKQQIIKICPGWPSNPGANGYEIFKLSAKSLRGLGEIDEACPCSLGIIKLSPKGITLLPMIPDDERDRYIFKR